ncbi:L-lactate dehydrogenase complex protein LldE [Lewinella marina]|uniref:Fe-S oxidoreductase n=1 Tax=Neolewinella marina TaxID=438751 RepID=A0A2G0CG34_9BACT|nr:(Fe-S)-binding protein [Neolewinella marina]NJB86613.1 L-lactate dehydrogenase complex protein LldE [Neolewinella marina]PHK98936.1 Fe-S oxidoreductase [Neolewinella marina]
MTVGLFIPCYIDQFYPRAGIATLELLEKVGCTVVYPREQTCCGQPLANSGMEEEARPIYEHFVETFRAFDYIVCPSGSCVYHVNHHYDVLPPSEEVTDIRQRTFELADFLVNVIGLQKLPGARFPARVGIHNSCHGLRGLRLGASSERVGADFSYYRYLLGMVEGVELVTLDRVDECCGFGGTFSVNQPELSTKMGRDRIADHLRHGAEVVTSGDMSCLMHLEGLMRREKLPLRVMHVAEILNSAEAAVPAR